jgi:hypothetical protein
MNNTGPKIEFGETLFHSLLEKLQAATYICDAEGLIKYFNKNNRRVENRP